jgi:radical SAM protein with 4Fe4S-binding SPASM domain
MKNILAAYIEITGVCNEKCPYCYNKRLVNSVNSLSIEVLLRLFDQLKKRDLSAVTFSGGEPFLYDGLDKLLCEAYKRNISVSIISNGTCFDLNNVDILLQFQPNIQITFDGYNSLTHDHTRGKGNFEKITNGIIDIRKRGYVGQIAARVNLHKGNIGNISDFLNFFSSVFDLEDKTNQHIQNITIAPLIKPEGSDVFTEYLDYEEYLKYPKMLDEFNLWNEQHNVQIIYDFDRADVGCPYNNQIEEIEGSLRIAADGNVFACQMYLNDTFSFGNIKNESLDDIFSGQKYLSFIENIHKRRNSLSECENCGYKLMCAGGCPALAFRENNSLHSTIQRCTTRKKYFNSLLQKLLEEATNKNKMKSEA